MDADLKPGTLVQVIDREIRTLCDIGGHGRLWIVQKRKAGHAEHLIYCRSIANGTNLLFYHDEITAAPTKET